MVSVHDGECGEECEALSQYKCGVHCVERDKLCHCGNSSITYQDWHLGERLCCSPPAGGQSSCRRDDDSVSCPEGVVIDKYRESCAGNCWHDEFYFGCSSTGSGCVPYRELCHGYPVCEDRSDLRYCAEDMTCTKLDWMNPSRCGVGSPRQIGHAECYFDFNGNNNGQYDCLDRTDEDKIVQDIYSYVNYSALTDVIPGGLQEGDGVSRLPSTKCPTGKDQYKDRKNWLWCNQVTDYTCANVSVNNPFLCQNKTFWSNTTNNVTDCNIYFDSWAVQYEGRRCSGEWQHCFSPAYMRVDLDRTDRNHWYQGFTGCRDKSDQIFPVNSVCDPIRYVAFESSYKDTYCNLFCRPGERHERCREEVCDDPRAWLSVQTSLDILDPHHCQESCRQPGPNCTACTNPQYFNCTRDNITVCLHPQLVCDSHPHCDNGEDEDATLSDCYNKLLGKGRILEEATVLCWSKMYPNIQTVATACNGVVECHDGSDEDWLCQWKSFFVYGVVVVLMIMIFAFLLGMKLLEKDRSSRSLDLTNLIQTLTVPDMDVFRQKHDDKDFQSTNNFILLRNKYFAKKEHRQEQYVKYYDNEECFHRGNQAEMWCCFKNSLQLQIFAFVCADKFPTLFSPYIYKCQEVFKSLKSWRWSFWTFKTMKRIVTTYLDILTDSLVVSTILATVGPKSLWYFPGKLTSVIIFCMLASIFCPLWLSCFLSAREEINKGKHQTLRSQILIYSKNFLFAFIKPLMILNSYEATKKELEAAMMKRKDEKKILELIKEGHQLKIQYVNFIRMDLGLGKLLTNRKNPIMI